MTKCINCSGETGGTGFCSGKCKSQYRSGLDPDKCVHCQNKATRRKDAYCSRRCKILHQ